MSHTPARTTGDISEFIDFLHERGIAPADSREIQPLDRTVRYTLAGDRKGTKNGAYRLGVVDGILMGWARSHKEGVTHNFYSSSYKKLTESDRQALQKRTRERRSAAQKETKEGHACVAAKAADIWNGAEEASPHHAYLARKGLQPGPVRQQDGFLLIPLRDVFDNLWNLQKISPQGIKRFLGVLDQNNEAVGGRVKGCFFAIGEPRPFQDDPFLFCEGYATGLTLHAATGYPVRCAMTAGNLLSVAAAIRWKNHYADFLFCADNDAWGKKSDGTPFNAGVHYAKQAAQKTGGRVTMIPPWLQKQEQAHGHAPTDFDDMRMALGLEAVTRHIEAALRGKAQ